MDEREKDLKSREIFYDYYVDLTNIIGHDTACLLPGLIRERIITTDDQAVIDSIPSPQAKAGKLLQFFSGPLEAGSKDSFVKLLQIMVNNGKAPAQTLAKEILKKLNIEPIIVARKEPAPHATTSSSNNSMKPKLAELLNWVVPQAADKWEKICVQLIGDEHRHIVANLRKDCHGSEDCCQRMFEEWLQLYPNGTWQDVLNALQSGSVRKIALSEELVGRLTTKESSQPSIGQLVVPTQQQQQDQQKDSQQMVTSKSTASQPSQESNDVPDGQKPAVIQPQAALSLDRGKGTVTDAVFSDIKKAVCRIHAPQMVATGFIAYVKRNEEFNMALVTNNHVIKTADDAMASRIAFENVFTDDHKVTLKGFQIFLKERGAFRCSPEAELDYTIIEIDETKMKDPESGKRLDIEPIYLMYPANIKNDDQVYVIQHPRGGKLAFSSSQCTVLAPLLLYECTTEMGSSGSPVLKEVNGDLKIVALHRGGKDRQWECGGYNCGTMIEQIVNHLNSQQCLPLPSRDDLQQALRRR